MSENYRRIEVKLGFDRIRKEISDKCSTEYAVNRVEKEEFSSDKDEIKKRLMLTDEMRLIVMFEDSFPTSGYVDCTGFLKNLENDGANIDLLSLGKLRTMSETLHKVTVFFAGIKDGVYPSLKKLTSSITIFPEVGRRIDLILDKFGNVKDTASDLLYEIRKTLKEKEGAISKRVSLVLNKARLEGIIGEDATVSIRDGKMLIPVPSANKRKIKGFVFDESASGKTIFIEPEEIVEIENEISELKFSEGREIFRILSEFSDFLRPYVPELLNGAECLCELDFIMAKAQTALEYIAGMPIISDEGEVNLRKARHPLLERTLKKDGKEMIPLTILLSPQKHILLISGPNAGGKSVCLKTMGLLQYMFQWGMLIPTSETSEMTVFDRIMVNIGDGQSIDNDLSTYSSFLISMKNILSEADKNTLVLIDEFGSGTEPAAGGAIAESILNEIDKRGVYGVITTHYTNLKLYASGNNTGVINGAMQFDAHSISPLFKLEIGMPGNSFAFELARKMGLPEPIVKDAENRAGEEYVGIEKNLRRIARNRIALDEKLKRIRSTDKALENITDRYQQELEGIKKIKKDIIDRANQEAEEIVKGANKQVENTIRAIKESQAEKSRTAEARKELQDFLGAITEKKQAEQQNKEEYIEEKLRKIKERNERRMAGKAARASKKEKEEVRKREEEEIRINEFRNGKLKVGEKVRLKGSDMVGEVSIVSNKAVTVIVGNISSKMPLDRVERITSNEYKSAVKENSRTVSTSYEDPAIRERRLNFKPEIDVRGERVNDALDLVMRFIDDAIMLDMSTVRIIHGKGTGALREELQKFIRTIPGVISVKDEQLQMGGTGVTVVTLE
jgi:hypothetical protein